MSLFKIFMQLFDVYPFPNSNPCECESWLVFYSSSKLLKVSTGSPWHVHVRAANFCRCKKNQGSSSRACWTLSQLCCRVLTVQCYSVQQNSARWESRMSESQKSSGDVEGTAGKRRARHTVYLGQNVEDLIFRIYKWICLMNVLEEWNLFVSQELDEWVL